MLVHYYLLAKLDAYSGIHKRLCSVRRHCMFSCAAVRDLAGIRKPRYYAGILLVIHGKYVNTLYFILYKKST